MKKFIVLAFTLMVILVPAYLFASACGSEGEDYYIKYTLEGKEYSLTYGYSDVDTGVPFVTFFAIEGGLFFMGLNLSLPSTFTGTPPGDVFYLRGNLQATVAGEYVGTYDMGSFGSMNAVSYIGMGRSDIYLYDAESETEYQYESISGTVTITTFGGLGEAVEGTFNITLDESSPPLGSEMVPFQIETPFSIEGSFRVKHVNAPDSPDY